jgi:hypothetical protein
MTGPVSVTVNGKTATNQPVFTVIPLPVKVHSVSPLSGRYNTVVMLTGENFLPTPSENTVTFNGSDAVIESATSTTLSVRVPERAGTGPIMVNGVAGGVFVYQPDIYIAGHLYDAAGYARATYWKNGVPVTLTNTGLHSYAYDLRVMNDDVYVVGYRQLSTHGVARLWKNGTEIPLTDDANPSQATEIVISGDDVYVVGYEFKGKQTALYWKNGQRVNLSDGTTHATATSIAIRESDIYVGGNSTHANGNTVGTYWKNGVAHTISDKVTFVHGIFVDGDDIYLTGSERNTGPGVGFPTFWKNGEVTRLGPGLAGAAGYDIVVSGTDVYVAGVEDNADLVRLAKYWKNGNPVVLSDVTRYAGAAAIDVLGPDVYVVGFQNNAANRNVVMLWKNGVGATITDGAFYAGADGIYLR